jgi:hypothetical protein
VGEEGTPSKDLEKFVNKNTIKHEIRGPSQPQVPPHMVFYLAKRNITIEEQGLSQQVYQVYQGKVKKQSKGKERSHG